MNIRHIVITVLCLSVAIKNYAQKIESAQKFLYSIGYETNTIYYIKDSVTRAQVPEHYFGSNNYLKADAYFAGFSTGIQCEAYLPAVQGYPLALNKAGLVFKYAAYRNKKLGLIVVAGDFYEQFGSGLLFRAWEERSLGINTSVMGGHIAYSFKNYFTVRFLAGKPRRYMDYADSWLYGADVSLDLSSIFSLSECHWVLEGSFLDKHELLSDLEKKIGVFSDIRGISVRTSFDNGHFQIKGEMVKRNPDMSLSNGYHPDVAKAYLVEAGCFIKDFGMMLSLRTLQNMECHSERNDRDIYTQINYTPALTQQHSYSLAGLNPYQVQSIREAGGQFDAFYNFKKESFFGGRWGNKIHLNYSRWYGPANLLDLSQRGYNLFFSDLSLDIEKKWAAAFKTTIFYSYQEYNPIMHMTPGSMWKSHILVTDIIYNFGKSSVRAEAQHLYTKDDRKNWCAALVEFSITPGWSFTIADMWNYGDTGIHYCYGGVSYSASHIHGSLIFGRFKEGYVCSGGVCRLVPAYSGLQLALSVSY